MCNINITPVPAREMIYEGVKEGLLQKSKCLKIPKKFTMKINFKDHWNALRASYFPGVVMVNDFTVSYTAASMKEVMIARMFIV